MPPAKRADAREQLNEATKKKKDCWLADAGFRWGLSGAHRAQLGLPDGPRHTLADALARLFLGYALPTAGAAPLGDLLPAGDAEGTRALPLEQ